MVIKNINLELSVELQVFCRKMTSRRSHLQGSQMLVNLH